MVDPPPAALRGSWDRGCEPDHAEQLVRLPGTQTRAPWRSALVPTPRPAFSRQAELATDHGAVAVSDPMGAEPEIAEVALHRYVAAAMDLVDVNTPVAADDLELPPVRHLSSVG